MRIALLGLLVLVGVGCASTSNRGAAERVELRPSSGEEQPAIVIRGAKGKVFDFSGRVLAGSSRDTAPDARAGVGILVEDCEDVTIRGAVVRGYKVGILGRNCRGLKLVGCDVSDNWMARLKSLPEKEDLGDWMYYHHNEKREWMKYGAGIYLEGCDYPEVVGCVATRGMNGLMMTRVNRGLVHSNAFTFLSSLGIGMYRSSNNAVMHNRLDYCVRGYSHGVYNRGQDSAAILIYESSHRNLFAYNSATHSGDGFFLWAGQEAMDSGWGGCNDNVVFGNDFSYAPTNGIEATFSRNYFVANQVDGCDHGVWGGYSYDSLFLGNTMAGNRIGFAIEHGQDNAIVGNVMVGNRLPVRLWANEKQDPNWGYPKNRDTRSRDYVIAANRMTASTDLGGATPPAPAISLVRTTGVKTVGNDIDPRHEAVRADAASAAREAPEIRVATDVERWRPPQIRGALDPFAGRWTGGRAGFERDRASMRITEWGPWDGEGPLLFRLPRGKGETRYVFELLGPAGDGGAWGVQEVKSGRWRREDVGGVRRLVVEPDGSGERVRVAVVYWGKRATTDAWGRVTPGGKAQVLTWEEGESVKVEGK